ncbi:MAG: hypothetical protein WBC85_17030 [Planktotalea sp.]|uniref:hypothetical protein n=1 Tax=Planktotalea sp. TaxID=2029877 RepID=UPI003C794247
MVNTSKVLTVSYGTFSCTLEGFDDSFGTMKAIAEYFRDLAADDRYFGAEPPTPDAEMLARIAEREVSRRVEAHSDGGKIVLRTTMPATSAELLDAPITENAEIAQDAAQATVDARDDTDAIERAKAEALAKAEADALAEAAAKAEARIAEEARLAEQAEIEARAEEERVALEASDRQAKRAAKRARIAEEKAAEEEAMRIAAQAEAEAEAAAAAEEQAELEAERAAEEEAQREAKAKAEAKAQAAAAAAKQAEQEDGDSVAAKLARIRAVVGQPAPTAQVADFSEDEHADDIMQGQPGDTDLEDLLEEDVKAEASPEDTISGVMSRLAADIDDTDEAEAEAAPLILDQAIEEIAAEPEAAKAPIRARVIKMKRKEFEAAIASGDLEEEIDEDADNAPGAELDAQPIVDNSSLSADDEDELARELAAVEAELAGLPVEEPAAVLEEDYDDEYDAYEEVQDESQIEQTLRATEELASAPDAEMDRLMSQASSELEEPDGKKRRNALGHLRAAVAAARADKSARPNEELVDDTLEYRDDLESAVQPRRPVRRLSNELNTSTSARPPLKLVAEQRIDTPAPSTSVAASQTPQPVRPRRIKVEDAAAAPQQHASELAPEGGSFAEFAEEMGATELPDLLEAAAAYMAYIEGKDQFSRPQLMTKVRMVQEENYSREDGLRSFGQLLRQGKIEKISGGRFTVSDRISFKPDARAAG